jgi:hypothetical protein
MVRPGLDDARLIDTAVNGVFLFSETRPKVNKASSLLEVLLEDVAIAANGLRNWLARSGLG